MTAEPLQCTMCGSRRPAYRINRMAPGGDAFLCCSNCWKKMKMAADNPLNIHDQLLSSLMKAAPRVTDRVSKTIREHLIDSIRAKMQMVSSPELINRIREIADVMVTCLRREGTIFACASGSSATEARHLVAELVGRYKLPQRRGLPAVCLTTCPTLLDDFAHHDIYVRQVEALVTEYDVLLGISATGNSVPVVRALRQAAQQGAFTIGLCGGNGGDMLDATRLSLVVPTDRAQTVQECQAAAIHILCDLIEQALCSDSDGAEPVMV